MKSTKEEKVILNVMGGYREASRRDGNGMICNSLPHQNESSFTQYGEIYETEYIFLQVLLQIFKNIARNIRCHYTNVSIYHKKFQYSRKLWKCGSEKVTPVKKCKVHNKKHELNKFVRLAIEHEMLLQVLMVSPLMLMVLYILYIEDGKLFWVR